MAPIHTQGLHTFSLYFYDAPRRASFTVKAIMLFAAGYVHYFPFLSIFSLPSIFSFPFAPAPAAEVINSREECYIRAIIILLNVQNGVLMGCNKYCNGICFTATKDLCYVYGPCIVILCLSFVSVLYQHKK